MHRPRYASRGQALIMAVLIMFLLVGLAGVFIAMISHTMVMVARAEERDKLENVALAGLRLAQNELLQGTEGADWRPDNTGPDTNNPGWVHQGEGFYRISVKYGPQEHLDEGETFLETSTDRFIQVNVEARYALENPPELDPTDPEYEVYRKGFLNAKRYITRKITSFVPVALTDHLLWVTNLDGSPQPVVLGTTLKIHDGIYYEQQDKWPSTAPNPKLTTYSVAPDAQNESGNKISIDPVTYLPVYEGPIRCDADVQLGNMALYLTSSDKTTFAVKRYDELRVAGTVTAFADATNATRRILTDGWTTPISTTGSATFFDPANLPEATNVMAVFQDIANNPLIKPLEPPRLDQRDRVTGLDRYRVLTRDSGAWDPEIKEDPDFPKFTGVIGWGEGLYLNNPDDIQHGGDLEKLREEWKDTASSHWQNGVYKPQCEDLDFRKPAGTDTRSRAMEVILRDWGTPDENGIVSKLPDIELRRYDGIPFTGRNGEPLIDKHAGNYYFTEMSYPRNGVVFAEGNVVVKGELPASLAYTKITDTGDANYGKYRPLMNTAATPLQYPGGFSDPDGDGNPDAMQYYVNESNRRYDLTIVSGGTIYIEGNLMGPASRAEKPAGTGAAVITQGSQFDSKLALLAMDNVCLNPTSLIDVEKQPPTESFGNSDERVWRVTHDNPLSLNFSTAGDPANLRILLRDAGHAREPANEAYTVMRMLANNTAFNWTGSSDEDGEKFYFSSQGLHDFIWGPSALAGQWSDSMFPAGQTFIHPRLVTPPSGIINGFGARNTLQFLLDTNSPADYLLSASGDLYGSGVAITGADLQVDALIYAQRGSWYIIPGDFYANDESEAIREGISDPKIKALFPRYHEPLDVRITINGAIVENRPAPLEDQELWIRHWRGANSQYFDSDYTPPDDPDNPPPPIPDMWDPGRPGTGWDEASHRWKSRRQGIEYHYDPTLSRPVCYFIEKDDAGVDRYNYLPRLPKLPVSPTVYSFGAMRGA